MPRSEAVYVAVTEVGGLEIVLPRAERTLRRTGGVERPSTASGPTGPESGAGLPVQLVVGEPGDGDVARRRRAAGLAADRHEVVDGLPAATAVTVCVGGVVDVGGGRRGQLRDHGQRRGADGRRVRVAVLVAGPGRVVAQVVPAEVGVVLELMVGQPEVGRLDRCSS